MHVPADSIAAYWPEEIVDSHVHLFPDRMFDKIWRAFDEQYDWQVFYRLYTPQALAFLRQRGIRTILYSNYAHRDGVAAYLNEFNVRLLEQNDDLFCFAAFHPEPEDSRPAIRRLLAHEKILGFKLQLLVQRIYPDDERLFPLYEETIEAGKRILMHAGTGPATNECCGVEHVRRLLKRFPDLPLTIPHLGAFEFEAFFGLLDEYPRLMLDTTFTFLSGKGMACPLDDETLLRAKDRLLYGSDFPNVIHPWDTEIRALLARNLGREFYRCLFSQNARRLLDDPSSGAAESTG